MWLREGGLALGEVEIERLCHYWHPRRHLGYGPPPGAAMCALTPTPGRHPAKKTFFRRHAVRCVLSPSSSPKMETSVTPGSREPGTRSPQLKEGVERPHDVRDFRIECLSLKHLMTGWKRKARTGFWCSVADRVRVSQGAFAYKRLFWLLCQALSCSRGRHFYSPASAGNSCLWR